ncbi:MAG: hypothetical protein HC837_18045 [Chloroflexaceae bacterium]|nr:hypothetical protein [Chloroflexaceae bacterium]
MKLLHVFWVDRKLRYKIIFPFLLLTLLVLLVGLFFSSFFLAADAQERFNNQLISVGRLVHDAIVTQEEDNLSILQTLAFAGANDQTGAMAMGDALALGDRDELIRAMDPVIRVALFDPNTRLDRLLAFDRNGDVVVEIEGLSPTEAAAQGTSYISYTRSLDLSDYWFVDEIISGTEDDIGDKYAGIITLNQGEGDTAETSSYLVTIVPVRDSDQAEVVGGLIVGLELNGFLEDLRNQSQAALVTAYTYDGNPLAATLVPEAGIEALQIPPDLVQKIRDNANPADVNSDQSILISSTSLKINLFTLMGVTINSPIR